MGGILWSADEEILLVPMEHSMYPGRYSDEIMIQRDAMMLRLRQQAADAEAEKQAVLKLRNKWLGCNETHL